MNTMLSPPTSKETVNTNTMDSPAQAVLDNDPHMAELFRQHEKVASTTVSRVQDNTALPVVVSARHHTGALFSSNEIPAAQSWTLPFSGQEKHPHIIRHRQSPPKTRTKVAVQDNKPPISPSKCSAAVNLVPTYPPSFQNFPVQTTPADNLTIVSSLDGSEGSAAEEWSSYSSRDLSSTSTSTYGAALNEYEAMLKASRKRQGTKVKTKTKQEPVPISQSRAVSVSSDYHTILAGRRKNKSNMSESYVHERKLIEYEKLLLDTSQSPRKDRKQKNTVLPVSQKLKVASSILLSGNSTFAGDLGSTVSRPFSKTIETDSSQSRWEGVSTVSEIAESTDKMMTISPTRPSKQKPAFKMEPVCLTSTSLEDFQKYSTASNDPVRELMIRKQSRPSAAKKEKADRPKKEVDEWTKILTNKESRYTPVDQTHTARLKSFDERLMTIENEGRIL